MPLINPSVRSYLMYIVMDIKTSRQESLLVALDIAQRENTPQHITSPITQGTPWSKFSVLTNPILGVFNMGQISASATSDDLSNTAKYPYFYRFVLKSIKFISPSNKLETATLANSV